MKKILELKTAKCAYFPVVKINENYLPIVNSEKFIEDVRM